MKLLISDLHMGSPLLNVENKVIELLQRDWEEIILMGDIYDTWFHSFPEIRRLYPVITKLLTERQEKIVYIVGNHDPKASELLNFWPKMHVVTSYALRDLNYLCVHGDEFDILVTKYSWLARILFYIHKTFAYVGINLKAWGREIVYSIAKHVGKRYFTKLVGDVQHELVQKYRQQGFSGVVVGHTHMPRIMRYPDGFCYFNIGDGVHNKTYGTLEKGMLKCVSY